MTSIDVYCCQFITSPECELNPLARSIIVHFGLWAMVAMKVFGTYIATEVLRHLSWPYSVVIALGEAALLYYLLK